MCLLGGSEREEEQEEEESRGIYLYYSMKGFSVTAVQLVSRNPGTSEWKSESFYLPPFDLGFHRCNSSAPIGISLEMSLLCKSAKIPPAGLN